MKKKKKEKKEKTEKTEKTTNKITITFLILSIVLLIASTTYFIILKNKNHNYDQSLSDLNTNIIKASKVLESDKDDKEEMDKKLEKLREDLKDNVEELEIWKEIKKKLEDALS